MSLAKFWGAFDNPPVNPDCFIALSYTVKDAHLPTKPTKAVIELAYKWWTRFPKAKIIMSTGENQGLVIPNSKVMAEYAIGLGVPKENIIEENKSRDTYENLVFSGKIVRENEFREPTLVVFDLHLKRTLAIAKKLGWKNFYWLGAYSKGEKSYGFKKPQTLFRSTIFLYEIMAFVYGKIRGQI